MKMKRKEDYPLQKVTLNLRDGDWEWLRTMHGRLGAAKVIRELVIGHRKRAEELAAQRAATLGQLVLPIADLTEGIKE